MSITYPLSIPTTIGIETIKLTANTATVVSQSPFTGEQQILKYPKETWSASITIPPTRRDIAEAWVAFLVALKGSYGTFLLGDPNATTPQGVVDNYTLSKNPTLILDFATPTYAVGTSATTLVVNGAGQTGNTLVVGKFPASTSNVLKAGDYIQLGSGSTAVLKKVLTDTSSDVYGNATLDIFPSLRSSPADQSAVIVDNAKGNFRLNGNATQWSIGNNSVYGISFDAIEAL